MIKDAIAADKYKSGVKEVLQSVKGSKLIIVSKSLESEYRQKLEEQAKSTNVAIYEYSGTSVQLGKLCNKPFRVSAIAIKSGTADEISAIISEKKDKEKKDK
ncbi:MAG: ribosomal L7Ae/L30e/S12e/Gadd45 family protein [Nitrososphaera sp.]